MSKKSSSMPRSWISSTKTCDTPRSVGLVASRRRSTPVVQNSSRVRFFETRFSSRMRYPTVSPTASPRSCATRAATETALIRRGCVHTTRVAEARPSASARSRTNWGHCVVLPQPVSPDTTVTWFAATAARNASRRAAAGRRARARAHATARGESRRARSRAASASSTADASTSSKSSKSSLLRPSTVCSSPKRTCFAAAGRCVSARSSAAATTRHVSSEISTSRVAFRLASRSARYSGRGTLLTASTVLVPLPYGLKCRPSDRARRSTASAPSRPTFSRITSSSRDGSRNIARMSSSTASSSRSTRLRPLSSRIAASFALRHSGSHHL